MKSSKPDKALRGPMPATGQTGDKAQAKKSSANSPTDPHKHGEKKTTH